MKFRLLTALLLACWVRSAQADTFFFLVRQWPFTPCGRPGACYFTPTKSRFTIHGLWKNFDTGRWPSFCRHEPFNLAALAPLLPQLQASWPSYFGADERFWAHEWEKHGTCAEELFPEELDYFNATLQLHSASRLEDALLRAGIQPDEHIQYTSEDIVTAVEEHLGSQPLVHCESGRLTEIWMCVNERLEFEDCSKACTGRGCHIENCAHPMLLPPPVPRHED